MVKLQGWFQKYNSWSYTKHRQWLDCKRAYYYNYVGYAIEGSSQTELIKKLKKLDGRFVIQGKIIHELIENYIKDCQSDRKISEEEIQKEYIARIEKYRSNARETIIEYYNGTEVNQTFFDKIRENGLDQLSLFFGALWGHIKGYKYLRHEQFDNFVTENTKAIVKVDYVCQSDDGRVFIYDWKTGSDNEEYESDLQVGAYALWASLQYHIKYENITCNLVYLTTGMTKPFSFLEADIEKYKRIIKEDFIEMNSSYEIKNFPASPEKRRCGGCSFASICDEALLSHL